MVMRQGVTDVFVVGGGPAGIAAAIAARQRGFSVTVADGCVAPIDKPCGEGLMPDGIAALAKLGVAVPEPDAHRFLGIRFVGSGIAVEALFPRGYGLGVRRIDLHRIMVAHAERIGVHFLWHTPVTGFHPDGILLQNGLHRARWIVGADGSASRVRRWAGLDSHRKEERRFAFRRHYRMPHRPDFMELHWGDGCQLYITPVGSGEVCVAVISGDPGLRLDAALANFPDMAHRLQGLDHASRERGAVSVTRQLERVCSPRVALIGDASGGVDAITGEGLCLAFRQADLLGKCLEAGSLAPYQQGHRKLARRATIMSKAMLWLDGRSRLRHRVLRAFAAEPAMFGRLLASHLGENSTIKMASSGLALGWKVVTA
jgi:flavin-dependent dehydrogenase